MFGHGRGDHAAHADVVLVAEPLADELLGHLEEEALGGDLRAVAGEGMPLLSKKFAGVDLGGDESVGRTDDVGVEAQAPKGRGLADALEKALDVSNQERGQAMWYSLAGAWGGRPCSG